MERFFSKVIRYRKPITAIFFAALLICIYLSTLVSVDYDIMDYLPADSRSTKALDYMSEEFGGDIPNARVLIHDADRSMAKRYKRSLEKIDGVLTVMWINDTIPLDMPLSVYPADDLEIYFRGGDALFIVTIDSDKILDDMPQIYELIGENNSVTGSAVSTYTFTTNTIREVRIITVTAVIFLAFILIFTMTSWAEPFVVLIGLGTAVLLNMGTHIIFGEISFITNAAGNILQMAVSLDYSVFLIHRFDGLMKQGEKGPEETMKDALTISASSILSSGLTTVIGFLALVMMRFRIGPDLGLALAKGIGISLMVTFLFMPGVILASYKYIDRTRHKSFLPPFEGLGKFVRKASMPLCLVFILIIVPSYYCSTHNSYYYGTAKMFGNDTRLGTDSEDIEDIFGLNDTYVMMIPRGELNREHALLREIQALPEITSVMASADLLGPAFPAVALPSSYRSMLTSENCERFVIYVSVPEEGEATYKLINTLYGLGEKYFPGEYRLAGNGVSTMDLKETITADMTKVNILAIGAVFFVLLITMKNIVLPALLVITIETAIWFNLSISFVTGTPLFYLAYLIISSIQLGATVDYAILFTEQYRSNRSSGMDPGESIVKTIADSTASVLTSAVAMTGIGFLMAAISTHRMLAQLGLLLGRGTLCSLFAVIFILPGLLRLFDKSFVRRKEECKTQVIMEKGFSH